MTEMERLQPTGEHSLGLGAAPRATTAADFLGHDGWAQRLLGPPVGGVDRRRQQKE